MSLNNKYQNLTSHNLKQIALLTMLIDHIGAIIIARLILAASAPPEAILASGLTIDMENKRTNLMDLYMAMRAIGRLAFPLYCFLLTEGFRHTRSKTKYIQRLLLFALISEIPFDLAFSSQIFDLSQNSVFLTLSLGFLMMWSIDEYEKKSRIFPVETTLIYNITKEVIRILICCAYMFLASILNTDYGHAGVLTIYILFRIPNNSILATLLATSVLSIIMRNPIQVTSLLSIIPIALYTGQKGPSGNRYLFYVFYPIHLLILTAVANLIQVP